jgi:hypothetical protein
MENRNVAGIGLVWMSAGKLYWSSTAMSSAGLDGASSGRCESDWSFNQGEGITV